MRMFSSSSFLAKNGDAPFVIKKTVWDSAHVKYQRFNYDNNVSKDSLNVSSKLEMFGFKVGMGVPSVYFSLYLNTDKLSLGQHI